MDEKFDQAILSNDQTHSFNSLGLFQTIKESSQQNYHQPYHIYQLIPNSIFISLRIVSSYSFFFEIDSFPIELCNFPKLFEMELDG